MQHCVTFAQFPEGHPDRESWDNAARHGNLAVFVPRGRLPTRVLSDYVDSNTVALAARHGQLETVQRLQAYGVPFTQRVLSEAVAGGHRSMVQWLFDAECPFHAPALLNATLRHGHIDLFHWLFLDLRLAPNEQTVAIALCHDVMDTRFEPLWRGGLCNVATDGAINLVQKIIWHHRVSATPDQLAAWAILATKK